VALPAHSGPRLLFQFRNHFSQTVGRLGRVISPPQGHCLNTGKHERRINVYTPNIHALSGIRIYDPSIPASEDSSCLRARGYCDRHINLKLLLISRDCLTPKVKWKKKQVNEDCRFLVCVAVLSVRPLVTLQRKLLPVATALRKWYGCKKRHYYDWFLVWEDINRSSHRHESLRSHAEIMEDSLCVHIICVCSASCSFSEQEHSCRKG
jgi:hypothetical protein